MYYYKDIAGMGGEIQRHIFQYLLDGGVRSFPLTDDNPNKVAYDAWVAEGNTATEWSPEA
jgi:hypothetical protein